MKANHFISAYPRPFSSIIISLGLLAVFITFASWVLLSYPIGTAVRNYFYGIDYMEESNTPIYRGNANSSGFQHDGKGDKKSNLSPFVGNETALEFRSDEKRILAINGKKHPKLEAESSSEEDSESPDNIHNADLSNSSISGSKENNAGCDLYDGHWFHDLSAPLYTNNTCPVLTQMQNCQGNGRPDKDYENWRWEPSQCKLPRFNASQFLELMSGKTLAFIGDSVARNQMESLLCILWQVEAPKNRGNRRMQRWFFKSKSVMIVRIWSSWLVHQTSKPFNDVPEGIVKLHLDIPDGNFMQYISSFDVIVLSSGHWFAKQSVYLLNNEIVGAQLWSLPNRTLAKINNVEAFGISVETILTAMVTNTSYTGLTIVRSYSPDHYEGGAWNTGGSCTGKVKPASPGELVENGFTKVMHEKQVTGFSNAIKKQTNRSKLKLMDITEAFSYRHDGHPGPYRSPDPNKVTKRGPNGRPPPQDCLHWCMPGPVDAWNEFVLEIIRREYEGSFHG